MLFFFLVHSYMFEKFLQLLIDRFSNFGNLPLCNMNGEHGLYINDFCMPLCARCLGIYLGVIISLFVYIFIIKKIEYRIKYHIIFFLLAIPCIFDGVLQYFFYVESNLIRRLSTGILLGISVVFSACYFNNYYQKKFKIK